MEVVTMSDNNWVTVAVRTHYLASQSSPVRNQYVFAYTITITNHSAEFVRLVERAWTIVDGDHKITRVTGEGVVGKQPQIAPGDTFSYTSGTVLATPIGTMYGHYRMLVATGEAFTAEIPSFRLAVPNALH